MQREDLEAILTDTGIEFHGSGGLAGAVPLSSEACAAARLFDGVRTLDAIGAMLEGQQATPPGTGFRLALQTFLTLCTQGVCHPAGPPVAAGTPPAPPVATGPAEKPTSAQRPNAEKPTRDSTATKNHAWLAHVGLLALAALLYLPLALAGGYGADHDSVDVVEAGRHLFAHGRYVPSRYPGYVVHELPAALLDRIGGAPLSNAATVLMSLWAIHSFLRILKLHDVPHGPWLALALIANPFYWAASTCTIDYVWALALLLGGYLACREERRGLGGVLLGLAIACRAASIVFVLALAGAAWFAAGPRRKSALRTCAFATLFGGAFYVPTLLRFGRRQLYMGDWSWLDYAVRFVNGMSAFWGHWAIVPLAVGILLAGRSGWQSLTAQPKELTLLCALTVVGYLALFARYPFEEEYMLPVAPFFAVLAGFWLVRQRTALMAWLALQTASGFVALSLVALPARYARVEAFLPPLPGTAIAAVPANSTRLELGLFWRWGHLVVDATARRHGLLVE